MSDPSSLHLPYHTDDCPGCPSLAHRVRRCPDCQAELTVVNPATEDEEVLACPNGCWVQETIL